MEGFLRKSVKRILVYCLILALSVPVLGGCSTKAGDDSKNFVFSLKDIEIPNPPMSLGAFQLYSQQGEVLLMGTSNNGQESSVDIIYIDDKGEVGDRFSLNLKNAENRQLFNLTSGDKYMLCWTDSDIQDAEKVVVDTIPTDLPDSEMMDMDMPFDAEAVEGGDAADETVEAMPEEGMDMPFDAEAVEGGDAVDETVEAMPEEGMDMPSDAEAVEDMDMSMDMGMDMGQEPVQKTFENGYHYQLVKLNREGKVILQKNLSDDGSNNNYPDVTSDYVFNRIIADEESVALFSQETCVVYDKDMKFVKAYKVEELDRNLKNANYYVDNKGQIYATYCDGKQFVHLAKYDIRTAKLGEDDKVPNAKYYIDLKSGVSDKFIISQSNSLFGYNPGDREFTKIVDMAASSVPLSFLDGFAGLDAEHMVVKYEHISDSSIRYGFLTKVKPEDVVEKTSITLATIFSSPQIKKAVYNFNTTHDDVCINILDYNAMYGADAGGTWETALDKLNTDIVSGSMPDILMVNNNTPVNTYIGKGLLEDIYPFIDADPEFNREDFNTHVWDVYSKDGKLYTLVPYFIINSYAVKKSLLNENTKWTLDEALKVQKDNNIRYFFSVSSRKDVIDNCLRMAGSQFVDIDKAECNFNTDEFKRIIEFASTFPEQSDYSKTEKEIGSSDSWYRNNAVMLASSYISSFPFFLSQMRGYFGEEPYKLVGFPSANGGISSFDCDTQLAMSAKSEHQEEIWEFMRLFLTDEFQSGPDMYSIPVSNKAFDQFIEKAKQPLYNEWTFEGVTQKDPMKYYFKGEEYDVTPFSDKEAEEMIQFINSINSTAEIDQKIMSILEEECTEYFNDNATLDEVCNRIQSRVQIYLYEIQ